MTNKPTPITGDLEPQKNTRTPDAQLRLFATAERGWLRRYGPCADPWQPTLLAAPHPDDTDDAVGLDGVDYCCAVHYVRYLRYKYNLDA